MKKALILLILFSIITIADSTSRENYLEKEQKLKVKLITILENLKKFKQEKNNKIITLNQELNLLKKEFSRYKQEKEKKIQEMNHKIKRFKKKLTKKSQVKVEKVTFNSKKPPIIVPTFVPKIKEVKSEIVKPKIDKISNNMPKVTNLPWVEIIVEDGLDIYQLALKYYGDENKYKYIYAANQQTLQNNFEITDGMSLKIPMPEQF